ncbi:MAG: hypothetical protein KC503_13555 [Myxococcales bacterium]|nr:hypothetical protein [Myxococcales bacterium]
MADGEALPISFAFSDNDSNEDAEGGTMRLLQAASPSGLIIGAGIDDIGVAAHGQLGPDLSVVTKELLRLPVARRARDIDADDGAPWDFGHEPGALGPALRCEIARRPVRLLRHPTERWTRCWSIRGEEDGRDVQLAILRVAGVERRWQMSLRTKRVSARYGSMGALREFLIDRVFTPRGALRLTLIEPHVDVARPVQLVAPTFRGHGGCAAVRWNRARDVCAQVGAKRVYPRRVEDVPDHPELRAFYRQPTGLWIGRVHGERYLRLYDVLEARPALEALDLAERLFPRGLYAATRIEAGLRRRRLAEALGATKNAEWPDLARLPNADVFGAFQQQKFIDRGPRNRTTVQRLRRRAETAGIHIALREFRRKNGRSYPSAGLAAADETLDLRAALQPALLEFGQ